MNVSWRLIFPIPLTFLLILLLADRLTAGQPDNGNPKPEHDAFGDPLPSGIRYRLGTTRLRHWVVGGLQFTPDGKQLISAGSTPDCMVWDVATGKLERTFRSAFPTAISPDARMSVQIEKEATEVREWPGGKLIHRFAVKELGIAVFTTDSKTLVGLTRKNVLYRWDLTTCKELGRQHFDLAARVYFGDPPASISPDGKTLAGVLQKDMEKKTETYPVHFWDVVTGNACRPSIAMSSSFYQCRWTPDGQRFIALVLPYGVEIWDLKTGKKVEGKKAVGMEAARTDIKVGDPTTGKKTEVRESRNIGAETVTVTPDGQALILAIFGRVALYDLESRQTRWSRQVAPRASGPGLKLSTVTSFAFSRTSKTLAVGCSCGHITLLDWTTGKDVEFSRRHPGFFYGPIHFSGDGTTMLIETGFDRSLSLRQTLTGKEIRSYAFDEIMLVWSNSGKRLVFEKWTKDDRRFIRGVNASTRKEDWRVEAWPYAAWFAADEKTVAYWDLNDRMFHLRNAANGKSVRSFHLPAEELKLGADPKAISADFKRVAVQSKKSRELQVWDMAGKKQWTWQIPQNWERNWDVRFLPGDRHVLVSSSRISILDAASGKKLRDFEFQSNGFVAASADGRLIALRGPGNCEIREIDTGRCLMELKQTGHRSRLVAFAPDGKTIAYNPDEYTVELREVATGKVLNRFQRDWHFIRHLAFTPDGQSLALAYNDSTLWMWNVKESAKKDELVPN